MKEEQEQRLKSRSTNKQQINKKRDHLVVGDILSMELPDGYSFNVLHIGMLYCLDVDKDGRYDLEDLEEFGKEVVGQIEILQNNKKDTNLEDQIKAYCTSKLWISVYGDNFIQKGNIDTSGENIESSSDGLSNEGTSPRNDSQLKSASEI